MGKAHDAPSIEPIRDAISCVCTADIFVLGIQIEVVRDLKALGIVQRGRGQGNHRGRSSFANATSTA